MNDADYTAAFMTGHSVPGCTGLSAVQRAFQQRSGLPMENWQPWNFPYHPTQEFPEAYPLIAASFNNLRHFLASRGAAFRTEHQAAVSELFMRHEKVLLVASSCGLELLRNLELPTEVLRRVHVFACGPVSLGLPAVASLCRVQGHWDLLSRVFHPQVEHRYHCGHLEYLEHPETMRYFNRYCQEVLG